jgi:hypothetical protein
MRPHLPRSQRQISIFIIPPSSSPHWRRDSRCRKNAASPRQIPSEGMKPKTCHLDHEGSLRRAHTRNWILEWPLVSSYHLTRSISSTRPLTPLIDMKMEEPTDSGLPDMSGKRLPQTLMGTRSAEDGVLRAVSCGARNRTVPILFSKSWSCSSGANPGDVPYSVEFSTQRQVVGLWPRNRRLRKPHCHLSFRTWRRPNTPRTRAVDPRRPWKVCDVPSARACPAFWFGNVQTIRVTGEHPHL